jgi:phospholipase C
VSNPEAFSKTVFIIDYDEADGSFDHILPPTPPSTPAYGASSVSIENEIVTTSTPNGPIGLGTRIPFLVISPWTKVRVRQFPGVRSHVGDPVYREALRSVRGQYLPLAACGGW